MPAPLIQLRAERHLDGDVAITRASGRVCASTTRRTRDAACPARRAHTHGTAVHLLRRDLRHAADIQEHRNGHAAATRALGPAQLRAAGHTVRHGIVCLPQHADLHALVAAAEADARDALLARGRRGGPRLLAPPHETEQHRTGAQRAGQGAEVHALGTGVAHCPGSRETTRDKRRFDALWPAASARATRSRLAVRGCMKDAPSGVQVKTLGV